MRNTPRSINKIYSETQTIGISRFIFRFLWTASWLFIGRMAWDKAKSVVNGAKAVCSGSAPDLSDVPRAGLNRCFTKSDFHAGLRCSRLPEAIPQGHRWRFRESFTHYEILRPSPLNRKFTQGLVARYIYHLSWFHPLLMLYQSKTASCTSFGMTNASSYGFN